MKDGSRFLFIIAVIISLLFQSDLTSAASSSSFRTTLDSEAYIVIDANSGEKLYGKNAKTLMYPASITKIVTAIMAIKTLDLDETVTISEEAVNADGTRVYLLENEEVTVRQLLYGLMVSSGNDAAIALAEHMAGSVEAFSRDMNEFVKTQIGVSSTHFTNPHGLFNDKHVTTASDMAKISAYAMKNSIFRDLVATESYEWISEGWETTLYNHHPLLRQSENVIGIKNGYVKKSGFTLVTAAEKDGTELIVVTLNSPTRELGKQDTERLLTYTFDHYETQWVSFDDAILTPEFIYPEKVAVTTLKNEPISYDVSNKGFLRIYGSGNRLLSLNSLEPNDEIDAKGIYEKEEVPADRGKLTTFLSFEWIFVTGFLFL
ncbi:D-alanyl-D-alanine carboxypeptidase [Salipaludibacillus sp. LMS25]|jgi:D-alanyl-D-alanine carboxypeptidase/D-alanyl-D-alanine carboxypeptidase (penicillin-binding protein 5/6)|uniref:D-alanyl-D-alanine carboxypeptidase family protein n=1 Tax=Salipaludibacillus sp. LMS25 TaxID=2924031 RepID=UPI0020D0AE61|nr:D-alanyl-D-alanine carboxypeptidase family protein [Salipaludibacillus sp. LMS25]UTR14713.1 D-alanyl-D-alanine carboxypeptidase [Salipaludibacillus sp. LMS25]